MASALPIQHPFMSPATQNIMDIVTSDYHLLLLSVAFAGCLHALCLRTGRIFLAVRADWAFVHGQHNQFLETHQCLQSPESHQA